MAAREGLPRPPQKDLSSIMLPKEKCHTALVLVNAIARAEPLYPYYHDQSLATFNVLCFRSFRPRQVLRL